MKSRNRLVLTKGIYFEKELELLLYLDAMNRPIEIHTFDVQNPSYVGNIYVAKVMQVREGMKAAFLQAGELKFFFPLEPIESIIFTRKGGNKDCLCEGDELLVQVTRDAIKTKEICVTANLSFSTEHVTLTTGKPGNGVSRKITGESRNRLKEFADTLPEKEYGLILRTSSQYEVNEVLTEECLSLDERFTSFMDKATHLTCGSLVQSASHPFIEHIHRIVEADDLEEVLFDTDYSIEGTKFLDDLVLVYEDETYPLRKLLSIDEMLDKALKKKVYLPSGGYLLIEPTETLTVIDVNSGKNVNRKGNEDYIWENNLEAAKEVVRQLRLRNISGMILVDFINMRDECKKQELLTLMRSLSKSDYVKVNALDFTRLDLMEITRAKKYRSLREQVL